MRVEYIAAAFDGSGYGEAARNNIAALHRAGVDISLVPLSFEQTRPDLGDVGGFLQSLITPSTAKIDARIVHLTPDIWSQALRGREPLPTIGYAVWEASRIPPAWVPEIQKNVQQLWLPSEHNLEAFSSSGIDWRTIRVVPHCFAFDESRPSGPALRRVLPPDERYRFLSVFQWIERKNPLGLLKAYLTSFTAADPVSLVLKTYLQNGGDEERARIREWIGEIKANLRLPSPPRIELVSRVLSRAEMDSLYRECDCFVLLHRCEGFGIPIAEAMLAEMPVVATTTGGPSDFLWPHERVPSTETPVYGMPWPTYTGAMTWGEPDLGSARDLMLRAFFKGKRRQPASRDRITEKFSYEEIGSLMRAHLREIVAP